MKSMKNNHFLHLIFTLVIIFLLASFFYGQVQQLSLETRNANRLVSAKLIVNAEENYQKRNKKYGLSLG